MKKFLSPLFLLFVLVAPAVAIAGNHDLIWDGTGSGFGADTKVKYKESPENGLIDQTLEVEIQNAPANTTFKVKAGQWNVGTMTTDAFGRGVFRKDIFGMTPDANGRVDGPRLETGDIVRVSLGVRGVDAVLVAR